MKIVINTFSGERIYQDINVNGDFRRHDDDEDGKIILKNDIVSLQYESEKEYQKFIDMINNPV